ncbi:MAG: M14 family metallocarboxypeptidase [Verrucomicrobia bacterium]|nr:M14 family metallocarboxypeptidase [Verrucomicrobiota bacterium]
MVSLLRTHDPRDLRALLHPLSELTQLRREWERSVVGEFAHAGQTYALPRFRFSGPSTGSEPVRLGLFAGVHGDEPAGCAALVEFAAALSAAPERAAGYELFLYPIVNPTGYEDGTRFNRAGLDLNREFWRDSAQPEVRLLEAELRARRFHGLITLHADDTCEGLYGYSHGQTLDDTLLQHALRAAERVLPRDGRPTIDGWAARNGVICECFQGILAAPADQRPRPFNVIFETPAHAPFALQVSAAVAALETIVAEYRGFIAYAQDL